jgi:hypothetical protein
MSRLDVKRLYLPGTVLEDQCPSCGVLCCVNLATQYLSYTRINEPSEFTFWCSACVHEWPRQILLTMRVELLPKVAP